MAALVFAAAAVFAPAGMIAGEDDGRTTAAANRTLHASGHEQSALIVGSGLGRQRAVSLALNIGIRACSQGFRSTEAPLHLSPVEWTSVDTYCSSGSS